ncbi:MAG: DNA polymerase III subunit alpha [Candidatus Taylorbacteria bacterium]|nr:DNA polymerase III subunit alpha [Candidatus Taylorbacteria bacterium]
MASKFVHLHVHSHYSLLSALPKLNDLVKKAKELGMTSLALTDNGNMYGAIEFYQYAKKNGIKPIIGVDAYVAVRTRKDMQAGVDSRRHRLILLAKDFTGYKNLMKLVTYSHLEGFYYKPRIDKELIEKYSEGIIAIAPTFSSEIAAALKMRDKEKAKEKIAYYKKVYGAENFYLEITYHPELEGHEAVMKQTIELAKETDTPLVAAHDVYYLNPEDKIARATLTLVNTHGDISDRITEDDETDFSFITGEKAEEFFKDYPKAIENTAKIADKCNLELTLGKWYFPKFIVESGLSHDDELKRLAYEGIEKRGLDKTSEVVDRLEYELKVIKDKGYAQYFLVVSDLLRFAHENNILTNIRGSVAGSLTTFVTHITNVNPLEYKLPFERFLNPERPSAPDIDMDFADNRRDEVIEYARKKYGYDKVAQIGTFGTMMARGAVRDVARAMGYAYEIGDKISKLIPMGAQGFPMTIDRALEEVAELKELYEKDADTKKIIDMAKKIEGCARHISVHAAGVVMAPEPLIEFVPLQFDTKGENKIITQYDMHGVGEDGVGLLKFDFLGIKNLSILADAVDRVKKIEGKDVDLENVPIEDKKTFEMLARGETIGLFQLNGTGMTKFLKDLKPSTIHDINAMVALYRPGPLESIPEYIERKHDPSKVKYLDPRLRDILDRSFGVITYQDDVMMIAIKLAGYSWLEADKLRKAMGKKIPKDMQEQKEKLLKGFVKGGLSAKKSEELWKLIEPFAAYGFNKCLTGDTKLADAKTGKVFSIKDIYEKNLKPSILSMNDGMKLESKKVSMVMENGEKDIFEIITRSGRKIKATDNHPFYTFSGWKDLKDLKDGSRIAVPRNTSLLLGKKSDYKKAAVLGYLLSEGNLCHPHGIYFYSTQNDEVNDFIKYATTFKNTKCTIDKSKSAMAVYCGQKDQKVGNELNKWIIELELKDKKATEKHIPDCVFEWDKNTLSTILGKMWQGDGSISIKNEQVYYATSSKRLADDTQHLLLRLGILSTIHNKKFKYRGDYKIGYTVVVTHRENISAFSNTVGKSLIGKKKTDLIKLAKNCIHLNSNPARGTKDIIPAEIMLEIRKIMSEKNVKVKEICNKLKISERLFGFDKRKIGYQRETIKKIGEFLKSKELLEKASSHIYWDEVISIKPLGNEMTYDITLPPHHNFVANDIVVHNSHAASYGRVAYQTSYMKANFPAIYMSAVLTADSGDVEKIGEIITECKRMGIPILPPDVNESFSQFTVIKSEKKAEVELSASEAGAETPDRIRFGLVTIKNFGQGAATAIIDERKRGGKFKSLADFLERVQDKNLNKKSLEALIKAGALDSFGERGLMLGNIDDLLAYNKEHANEQRKNQDSLFGGALDSTVNGLRLREAPAVTPDVRLAWEKELLGLYVSGHPLDKFRAVLEKRELDIKKAKENQKDGQIVILAGIIEEAKQINTKKGDVMMFLKITDFSGSIEAVCFPRTYLEFRSLLVVDKCIAFKGKMSERNGSMTIIIEKMRPL